MASDRKNGSDDMTTHLSPPCSHLQPEPPIWFFGPTAPQRIYTLRYGFRQLCAAFDEAKDGGVRTLLLTLFGKALRHVAPNPTVSYCRMTAPPAEGQIAFFVRHFTATPATPGKACLRSRYRRRGYDAHLISSGCKSWSTGSAGRMRTFMLSRPCSAISKEHV